MSKYLDSNGLLYFWNKIKTLFVAKETGKGLSSNDYTSTEKTKLAGIADNANNYTLPAATTASLGGIVIGDNLTVDANGRVSASGQSYNEATTTTAGLMSSTDKAKLNAFSEASAYALKTDIASMYKYKGSVATYSLLPASGDTVGDVYNVEADGQNYAWDGTAWDSLGGSFTISDITNADIDTIVAS